MPEFVAPNKILNQLGLRPDMTVADFGCGSGGWTIPLAKMLDQGRVWAVDVQPEPLSALTAQAKLRGVFNIKNILADVEVGVDKIKDSSCDLILMTDLLFQVEDKQAVFQEARRVLKPGAKLLVVDWKPDSLLGPKQGRISKEEVKKIAESVNFKLDKELEAGDYHYGLTFVKE